jgi:hypothetical protein
MSLCVTIDTENGPEYISSSQNLILNLLLNRYADGGNGHDEPFECVIPWRETTMLIHDAMRLYLQATLDWERICLMRFITIMHDVWVADNSTHIKAY